MLHVTRKVNAYRLPVRRKGQKGSEGEAVGRKVWVLTAVKMKTI